MSVNHERPNENNNLMISQRKRRKRKKKRSLEKVIVFLIALVASVVIFPEKQALVLEPRDIWKGKSLHKLE